MHLSIKNPEQMVRNMWPNQYTYDLKGSVYMEVGIPGMVSNLRTWGKRKQCNLTTLPSRSALSQDLYWVVPKYADKKSGGGEGGLNDICSSIYSYLLFLLQLFSACGFLLLLLMT